MKPKNGLVVEQLPEGGCLILDEDTQMSHALRPEAAAVWACLEQGATAPEAISRETGLSVAIVERAVAEIAECRLIEGPSSRRQLFSRAATIAGAAAGLQLIDSIATPTPAAAQSQEDTETPV